MTDNVITPPAAYIKQTSDGKGRGVFAAKDFRQGELIECAPVLVIERPFKKLPPRLQHVVYHWQALTDGKEPGSALVYGYGSLYNHNNPANIRYQADTEQQAMVYVAARDIAKDEELTVNYNNAGGEPVSDSDNWFEMQGIKPIIND